jgi:uncharacterized membrane protein YidH (DUF202 family)
MSALAASVTVDTQALLEVIGASLVITIGVTVAFSVALYGVTRADDARRKGPSAAVLPYALLAFVGLAACVTAIVLGLIVMTQK